MRLAGTIDRYIKETLVHWLSTSERVGVLALSTHAPKALEAEVGLRPGIKWGRSPLKDNSG